MIKKTLFIIAVCMLLPAAAWAQEDDEDATPTIGGKPAAPAPAPAPTPAPAPIPAPEERKPAYTPPKMDTPTQQVETQTTQKGDRRLREVIKGFYVEGDLGYMRALATDIPQLAGGFVTGILIGYDIIDILSVEAGFLGAFVYADNPTDQNVDPDTAALSSDFSMKIIEANVKVSYISTDHWFFYLRAGGGFALNSPSETRKPDKTLVSVSSGAPIVSAAPGVEWYTNVRHFSIGLDPKVYMLPTLGSYFLTVTPYVKYTF